MKTRISTTPILRSSVPSGSGSFRLEPSGNASRENRAAGFTLIELTIVIFLMGLMLVLTVPRIQETFLHDDMASATRRMVGAVRNLRDKAVRERREYRLHLDMDSNQIWYESDGALEECRLAKYLDIPRCDLQSAHTLATREHAATPTDGQCECERKDSCPPHGRTTGTAGCRETDAAVLGPETLSPGGATPGDTFDLEGT